MLARGLLDASDPEHKSWLDREFPEDPLQRELFPELIDLTGDPRPPPPDPLEEARPAQRALPDSASWDEDSSITPPFLGLRDRL